MIFYFFVPAEGDKVVEWPLEQQRSAESRCLPRRRIQPIIPMEETHEQKKAFPERAL
jgi:hypothetical protein